MTYLIGSATIAIFKDPRTKREARYWAERGIIRCEDSKNGYTEIGLEQARHHLFHTRVMLGKSSELGIELDHEERRRLNKFCDDMLTVIQMAREQGDPLAQFRHEMHKKMADLPAHVRAPSKQIPAHFFIDMD